MPGSDTLLRPPCPPDRTPWSRGGPPERPGVWGAGTLGSLGARKSEGGIPRGSASRTPSMARPGCSRVNPLALVCHSCRSVRGFGGRGRRTALGPGKAKAGFTPAGASGGLEGAAVEPPWGQEKRRRDSLPPERPGVWRARPSNRLGARKSEGGIHSRRSDGGLGGGALPLMAEVSGAALPERRGLVGRGRCHRPPNKKWRRRPESNR